jgi:hypothetical protein
MIFLPLTISILCTAVYASWGGNFKEGFHHEEIHSVSKNR